MDVGVLAEKVTDGGATLHSVTVEGKGRLEEKDGAWSWAVAGTGQRIPVSFEGDGAEALLRAAREAAGRDVEVTGEIDVPRKGEGPRLRLTAVR